jgi:hypothetical protein
VNSFITWQKPKNSLIYKTIIIYSYVLKYGKILIECESTPLVEYFAAIMKVQKAKIKIRMPRWYVERENKFYPYWSYVY